MSKPRPLLAFLPDDVRQEAEIIVSFDGGETWEWSDGVKATRLLREGERWHPAVLGPKKEAPPKGGDSAGP